MTPTVRTAVITAALTALTGCASSPATTAPNAPPPPAPSHAPAAPALRQVHDPGHVTGSVTGPCHDTGPLGRLPDPRCTAGAVDPAVTQADIGTTICRTGWTKTVRPPAAETTRFKYHVAYVAYGLPSTALTELDHLVPLELGGSNDAANLWPELGDSPNPKDSTEDVLHAAVCAGKVPLAAAQQAISRDWTTAEKVLGLATGP